MARDCAGPGVRRFVRHDSLVLARTGSPISDEKLFERLWFDGLCLQWPPSLKTPPSARYLAGPMNWAALRAAAVPEARRLRVDLSGSGVLQPGWPVQYYSLCLSWCIPAAAPGKNFAEAGDSRLANLGMRPWRWNEAESISDHVGLDTTQQLFLPPVARSCPNTTILHSPLTLL
jgi:hypothetical protein